MPSPIRRHDNPHRTWTRMVSGFERSFTAKMLMPLRVSQDRRGTEFLLRSARLGDPTFAGAVPQAATRCRRRQQRHARLRTPRLPRANVEGSGATALAKAKP